MLELLIKSFLISYSGAVMPGSLLTYTIDKSIRNGAKSGLLISLGHSLLEFFLVLLILLGLAEYLGTGLAQAIIGLIGGILLVFMGSTMIKDAFLGRVSIDIKDSGSSKKGNMLIGGAVISASNPYFILWWAAVGLGLVTTAYKTFGITGVIVFYTGHIFTDISWYCFISFLVGKSRRFISNRIYLGVIVFLGLCLIGFGLSFIYNSYSYFL